MSTLPAEAQTSAAQKSSMIVAAIVRPIGDGGVSTISSAAGRNASSSTRLACARRNGVTRCICVRAGSEDFMNSCLQSMQRCVAAAGLDQRVVGTVFDQTAAIERDDAISRAHGREPVRDDQHRSPFGDLFHVVLNDALALIVEGARRFIKDQDARVGDKRASDGNALAL